MSTRILTLNTHLFGHGPLVRALSLAGKRLRLGPPLVHAEWARCHAIAELLAARRADVAGLCEVFDPALARCLARSMPHAFVPVARGWRRLMSPGLVLLSAAPLSDARFVPFRRLASYDRGAAKGIARATLPAADDRPELVVHLCHTQASYPGRSHDGARAHNLRQIADEVAACRQRRPEAGVVVMGDLNVVAEDPDGAVTAEYRRLCRAMARVGLVDAYRAVHTDPCAAPGHTMDGRNNGLARLFCPLDRSMKRLDYVLVGPPLQGTWTGVEATGASVMNALRPGNIMSLSDHHALEVDLRWTRTDA